MFKSLLKTRLAAFGAYYSGAARRRGGKKKKSGCFAKSVAICGDRGCDPVMCLFLFETDWKHG